MRLVSESLVKLNQSQFFERNATMKKILIALGIVLLASTASYADWYYPGVVTAYYPGYGVSAFEAPAYVAPAPVAYSAYYAPYAPVVVARPRVAYMPVAQPVVVAQPMVAPVLVGPPAVIRSKVYYPGYPVRNTIRAVLP
jgi:hypothetical protein